MCVCYIDTVVSTIFEMPPMRYLFALLPLMVILDAPQMGKQCNVEPVHVLLLLLLLLLPLSDTVE